MWLSEKEASEVVRVDAQSLGFLRQRGYLKPGPHRRRSKAPKKLPWKQKNLILEADVKK